MKKLSRTVIFATVFLATLTSTKAQALDDAITPQQTVEQQAVQVARAVNAEESEEDAAAIEELIASQLQQIKACENEAAERYAEQIRCINSLSLTSVQKRQLRECARENFLAQIENCHGNPIASKCAQPSPCTGVGPDEGTH